MKRWWFRLLQLVLLVLVGWGIYRAVAPELARLRAEDLLLYRPSVPILALSTALLLFVYLLHGWLWRAIAVALSGTSLSIRPAMRIYFVSSLGRYLPGKLWQIAGLAVLAQREGFSPVAATAASLFAQLAFLTTGTIFLASLLPTLLRGPGALAAIGLVVVGVAAFLIAATNTGKAIRHRLLSRLGPRLAPAGALLDLMNTRTALLWWGWFALSWVLLGTAFALFVTAFVPAQAGQYRYFAGVAAASYLGGYIAFFAPAGLGVREGTMMILLATTLPASAALLIAVASRLWFTAGELLPLLLIPLLRQPLRSPPVSREAP